MIPTATQLITVVILLVPGFISIQVLSILCPTRRLSTFDATVISIIFSLLIHGTFTLGFIHLHTDTFNDLIHYIKSNKWPTGLSSSLILYLLGLLIYSVIIGTILSFLKSNGRFHKFIHYIGFNYSEHENLWDEMMYLYNINGETPVLIIHFEKESYAGWVYRASFDLEENERKEIILSNPRYKDSDGEWSIMQNDLLYLDLSEVSSIEYIGSKHILNSKY
ncbi:hypothetical protein ABD68_19620 [Bacillus endophyticus]|uniref:DUF6338 family protein n=1 Tax=Priestia endophytica TaxID=135735 RepID=UPI0018CD377A|nr:DUF6338 family protein [Priestia endophytica]MBG9813705.1 hypothetical protein [Priestia endophytica]